MDQVQWEACNMSDTLRNQNFDHGLLAASSDGLFDPVLLWADKTTHELLVQASVSGGTVVATQGTTPWIVNTASATGAAIPSTAFMIGVSDGTNLVAARQASNGLNTTAGGLQAVSLAGQLDNTSPTTITENSFGNLRIAANRSLLTAQKSQTATQSSVGGSATSVALLAANTARLGASVFNDSTAVLYINLGATASTTAFVVKLQQDDYWESPFGTDVVINGIWASATGSARICEYT